MKEVVPHKRSIDGPQSTGTTQGAGRGLSVVKGPAGIGKAGAQALGDFGAYTRNGVAMVQERR